MYTFVAIAIGLAVIAGQQIERARQRRGVRRAIFVSLALVLLLGGLFCALWPPIADFLAGAEANLIAESVVGAVLVLIAFTISAIL